MCVRASVCDQNIQFATSLSFMNRFWFCLLYMIALHGSFKTSTQNFGLWPLTLTFDLLLQNDTKCYSFAIFHPILIPFALCDSTRCGLQNFYTEFWPLTPLTFDLDLLPILYILLQIATPSPFLTRFRFRLLYVIALGEGFKTSTQNFDLWRLWPLTLIFYLYCTFC